MRKIQQQLQLDDLENMAPHQEESTETAQIIPPMSYLSEKTQKNLPLPLASVNILKKQYQSKQRREPSSITALSSISSQELSVVDLIKMAREKMSLCISQNLSFDESLLPVDKSNDLQLALILQAAALKFSRQQFDHARNLLSICQQSASFSGSPLQRVLYYFTEALQDSIMTEMGVVVPQEALKGTKKNPSVEEAFTSLQPAMMECHEQVPFCRVTQFTAIQAILDNVASARRVHLIDLGIKSGSHWPILMQALASRHERPLEFLKITAVGSSTEMIEEIGKKLSSFAESLNIPFAFKIVVSDLKNLDRNMFDIASGEVLAIYSELRLATLLAWPHNLESLLETIKKLKPCVMVTIEIDSNTNAPVFMDRFNASLSVCSTIFDCLDVCMDRDNPSRAIIEGVFLREGIQYLVTAKGEESIHRQESIGFWRAFLKKFGMVELQLSNWALYQANLVVKSNPSWSSCTLELNGKGMTVGWKGTPVHFLTAWKC